MEGIEYFQNKKFFEKLFGFFQDLGVNFWEEFLGGFFLEGFFWRKEFFVYIGIDLSVKILIFVKILSQWRRKEEE